MQFSPQCSTAAADSAYVDKCTHGIFKFELNHGRLAHPSNGRFGVISIQRDPPTIDLRKLDPWEYFCRI